MFTIAICDDKKEIRDGLSKFIDRILGEKRAEYKTFSFSNGDELLNWLYNSDVEVELLFLDIEMPGITGVEVKSELEKNDKVKRIVFATSHYENMQEAFGAKVIGFMLKPLQFEEIKKRLENVYQEYEEDVLIEIAKDIFVKKSEVSYIKAEGNYCDFYCIDGKAIKAVRSPLSHYKKIFGDRFIQVHKSYIVNACDIKRYDAGYVALSNNIEISIGRSYINSFKTEYRTIAMNIARGRL
ncbi:LytR/AlgR family response regulator transcription factor [Pseudobutyrivibrio sp.]